MTFPTWIVGCGKMAGAMVEGWRRAGVLGGRVLAVRPSGQPVEGATVVTKIPSQGEPRFVLLGIKPQKLDDVAPELEPHVGPDTLLVSILAGVELASLRKRFPRAGAILRAMPNLPVSEGKGVVALISEEPLVEDYFELFGPLGLVLGAKDEAEFGSIGDVAGAGPAYVARFIAALAKAGAAKGLDEATATKVALATVLGTATMAEARGEDMESIAKRVASPNGTTEAGLRILDGDAALDTLIAATLDAAARREQELAAAARG